MAGLRLRLLIAVALGVVACSSGSSPAVDTPNVAVEQDASTTTSEAPTVEAVESRQSFRRLAERTEIFVDGAYVATATGVVECFAGTCSSPLDYERGVEIVIPPGAELRFDHPDIDLTGSARRLDEELQFRRVETDGSSTFRLAESGLHHLSVVGELHRENGHVDRFHHFAWVQVTEQAVRCGDPLLPAGTITGVTDQIGCPSDEGELNFESLHPSFHCHPWPAELRLDERPGSGYVRAEPDSSGRLGSAGSASGLHSPSGPVFFAVDSEEELYVFRFDQAGAPVLVERWVLQEEELGCM